MQITFQNTTTTEIHIANALRQNITTHLDPKKKYAIITDDKVEKLYIKSFQKNLRNQNISHHTFTFKNGEQAKNLTTFQQITEQMLQKNFDRQSTIIAYGGGVVSDVAGFIASTYMRGIPYINIPTTLLAMVDACLGGKTGLNTKLGKNLIGTFHQPQQILIDPQHLQSLSQSHIKNGLAEVIKMATTCDKNLFQYLENNSREILNLSPLHLSHIIQQALNIKAKIVQQDQTDQNKRLILNYGHSFGHKIEQQTNYKLLHGFAVSIGIVLANNLAVKQNILTSQDAEKIKKLLKTYQLPTTTLHKPKLQDLINDKKHHHNKISMIFPTKIGQATIKQIPCI